MESSARQSANHGHSIIKLLYYFCGKMDKKTWDNSRKDRSNAGCMTSRSECGADDGPPGNVESVFIHHIQRQDGVSANLIRRSPHSSVAMMVVDHWTATSSRYAKTVPRDSNRVSADCVRKQYGVGTSSLHQVNRLRRAIMQMYHRAGNTSNNYYAIRRRLPFVIGKASPNGCAESLTWSFVSLA